MKRDQICEFYAFLIIQNYTQKDKVKFMNMHIKVPKSIKRYNSLALEPICIGIFL